MQLKFFAVAISSLAIGVNTSALPTQGSSSSLRSNPSPPENILAEAHSYADADIEEVENDKYDHSDFYAQAYAAAFGDEGD